MNLVGRARVVDTAKVATFVDGVGGVDLCKVVRVASFAATVVVVDGGTASASTKRVGVLQRRDRRGRQCRRRRMLDVALVVLVCTIV
jgi:hypothetical protein